MGTALATIAPNSCPPGTSEHGLPRNRIYANVTDQGPRDAAIVDSAWAPSPRTGSWSMASAARDLQAPPATPKPGDSTAGSALVPWKKQALCTPQCWSRPPSTRSCCLSPCQPSWAVKPQEAHASLCVLEHSRIYSGVSSLGHLVLTSRVAQGQTCIPETLLASAASFASITSLPSGHLLQAFLEPQDQETPQNFWHSIHVIYTTDDILSNNHSHPHCIPSLGTKPSCAMPRVPSMGRVTSLCGFL